MIGQRRIALEEPHFVIAQVGLSFDRSFDKALRMIDATAAWGPIR